MTISLFLKIRLGIVILNRRMLKTKIPISLNKWSDKIINVVCTTIDGKRPLFINALDVSDLRPILYVFCDGVWYTTPIFNLYNLKRMGKMTNNAIVRLKSEYGSEKWNITERDEKFFMMYLLMHYILRLGDDSNILKKFKQTSPVGY